MEACSTSSKTAQKISLRGYGKYQLGLVFTETKSESKRQAKELFALLPSRIAQWTFKTTDENH